MNNRCILYEYICFKTIPGNPSLVEYIFKTTPLERRKEEGEPCHFQSRAEDGQGKKPKHPICIPGMKKVGAEAEPLKEMEKQFFSCSRGQGCHGDLPPEDKVSMTTIA